MHRQPPLPGLPEGAIKIPNTIVYFINKEGTVTYFVGSDNYFSHSTNDLNARRWILATFINNGHVRPRDLEVAPLNIPHRSLMNWIKQLREKGPSSFFLPPATKKPRVFNPEVVENCLNSFSEGLDVVNVAKKNNIKESTLRKAMKRGLFKAESSNSDSSLSTASNLSERSRRDSEVATQIGTACTRTDERIFAAMGLAESATTRFEMAVDVKMGALLVGLPALCNNGLLSGIGKYLHMKSGFYSCLHILFTLAFMALGRIKRPENLRHIPPGEFGKVIGLDRVPEVRTLREKITEIANSGNPQAWMENLSKDWMEGDPTEAGYLYVDGHVRVYNGEKALLPRRFVSRERLCLRGTTDYWVNDAIGCPFFVVSKTVTEGLAHSILNDIVPKLLEMVPNQPTKEELDSDPLLHRFVMVFDREGSTYSLLSALWEKRIGVITYRKNVKDLWAKEDFQETKVEVPGGGCTKMMLATKEKTISAGEQSLPVTEVRRLTESGHQTSIITTARKLVSTMIAGRIFSRWCQENFFAYMMEHYDIDGLVQYGAEEVPDTTLVVNPEWKKLDFKIKEENRKIQKLESELGNKEFLSEWKDVDEKAKTLETIVNKNDDLKELRKKRKETKKKIPISSLPKEMRPTQLLPLNKKLTDTVKMIAYRAETALVSIIREYLNKEDEARALIRELLVSSADLISDETEKTLTIKVHRMACQSHDKAISYLLEKLTGENFNHPETGARMIFTLV